MLFLPADVARLVLDYLGSEGYEKSCATFLLECSHVTAICDYIDQNDADIKDLLPLTDKSLINILHEYSVNKLALKKQQKHQRQRSHENVQVQDESELNTEAILRPFQGRNQNLVAMRRMHQLQIQQAKAATLSPIVSLKVTKAYSDIPPGAVIIDPPDVACHRCPKTKDVFIGQNQRKSRQTANAHKHTSTECLPTSSSSQVNRVLKNPADFCNSHELNFFENVAIKAKLNAHPAANHHEVSAANQNGRSAANQLAELATNQCPQQSVSQYADETEPMEFISATSSANRTSPGESSDEQKQQTNNKQTKSKEDEHKKKEAKSTIADNDLRVKTGNDSTFTLADEDIKEFPILLEKLLNDSYLQQKLAENINKARPSENNQPTVSTPLKKTSEPPEVESQKIFTDSFLDAHLSEDTIQDFVEMTTVDPAFEGLFNLFNVSKQDFLQENVQQKEKLTSEEQPSCENLGRLEQNQSPTKPSFLFNECSNSAMIPTSPERPTNSTFLEKAQWEESSDLPENTGHRRKSRKPAKKDVLETSSIMMPVTPKKTETCARTSPYTSRKTNDTLSKTSVDCVKSSKAKTNLPINSSFSESVCVISEQSDNSVSPSTVVIDHHAQKQILTDIEFSQEIIASSEEIALDTNRTDCKMKPSAEEDTIETAATIAESKNVPHTVGSEGEKVIEMNNVSLKCFETFPEYSPSAAPSNSDQEARTISSAFSESTDIAFYNNTQSEDQSSDHALASSNTSERNTKGDEETTSSKLVDASNDLPSEEAEDATTVSIAASILAFAMQESRSPIKLNHKLRPSPRKTKQLTPIQDVSSTQDDNLPVLNNQTTVSSTSGCSYELKPTEVDTEIEPVQSSGCTYELQPSEVDAEPIQSSGCNYELQLSEVQAEPLPIQSSGCNYVLQPSEVEAEPIPSISVVPIVSISHKSEPSHVIYSCPVEVGNKSVIRPKSNTHSQSVTDNASSTNTISLVEYRKKRQRVPAQIFKRPIMPAGLQLPSVNQVINIPCLIDPLLIGPGGQLSAPIPVTYVPHDGDSNSLDSTNIFDKLANLPVIPFCQTIDSDSLHARQITPVNQSKMGVNVVSNWQYVNNTQPHIISSVASKSDLIAALGVNGNQNRTSTTKVASRPVKKSNRGKRRIRPIPVSSEQFPQNTAFMSAVEVPGIETENTKKLQTIDLMDLHAIQTASPQKCINIRQTPVKVVVRRSADGVTSLEEIATDTSQSPADSGSSPQVIQGSASKSRAQLRKQDLSKQSHIRILDFEEASSNFEPKEKSTKPRKSTTKVQTKKQIKNKTIKKCPPKEKSTVVNKKDEIKTYTAKKLGEDLPLKKRPLPDSTCELLYETPTKLNSTAEKGSSKKKTVVRRSPRRKTTTKKPKEPCGKLKPEEKITKARSPRKVTNCADQIQKGSPAKHERKIKSSPVKKERKLKSSPVKKKTPKSSPVKKKTLKSSPVKKKTLKSSLKQTDNVQEVKSVSFGEVDCITLNSPDVSHNIIDQEVNEAAQLLMDMASSSPHKYVQETVVHVFAAQHLEPDVMIPRLMMSGMTTPDITPPAIETSPRKSPRKHMAEGVIDLDKKTDRKRKRDANADKSKKSTKKRKGFPKNMDVDKFLSRLQYCD